MNSISSADVTALARRFEAEQGESTTKPLEFFDVEAMIVRAALTLFADRMDRRESHEDMSRIAVQRFLLVRELLPTAYGEVVRTLNAPRATEERDPNRKLLESVAMQGEVSRALKFVDLMLDQVERTPRR